MVEPVPIRPASVSVVDDRVVVHELEETDRELVALVSEADDPTEATRRCLRIGARAVRAANASVDVEVVEHRFDELSSRFDRRVDEALQQIDEMSRALLDEEDGDLTSALAGHSTALEELLGSTFDPESKRSVLALFERTITEAHERHVEAIGRLVDADGEDSPLLRVKREIVRDVKEGLTEVRREVRDLSERVGVAEEVAAVVELTSGKGRTYEDVVHDAVDRIAAGHGDLAEQTGDATGAAGTKKGDEVVTLARDDCHGVEARFVLEVKNRKLGKRKTVEELDGAMANREARAAVAVFSAQDKAPTSVPFQYIEDKAVVVLAEDGTDDAALRLAYMWARWVVRRSTSTSEGDELDLARIGRLIEDARRAIERASTIKRYHSQVRNSIEKAAEETEELVAEVEIALDGLAEELTATAA